MCNAGDTYPKFNTRHQCRSYEKNLNRSVKHAVHIPESEVTRFEDTVDIPLPSTRCSFKHDIQN
ncbi:hypothetical protein BDR04DRAFT_1103581 [Suillus decipiens]|nr:hypothetical protein BDR04DRAFT_1103581 [Suillus decipiens]